MHKSAFTRKTVDILAMVNVCGALQTESDHSISHPEYASRLYLVTKFFFKVPCHLFLVVVQHRAKSSGKTRPKVRHLFNNTAYVTV